MQPVAPRPAATVVLVRPDRSVLLVQRNRSMSFFGGAYAFPGGRVDPEDVGAVVAEDPWRGHQHPVAAPGETPRDKLYGAYVAAARREVKEETGLDVHALVPWARWITPEVEPKRYDTLFFLGAVGADATVAVDGGETVGHLWLAPEVALATKDIALPPPTQVTLKELAAFETRDAMISAAGAIPEIMPALVTEGENMWLVLPGDPLHPGALSRPWPKGLPTRARLGEGPPAFSK